MDNCVSNCILDVRMTLLCPVKKKPYIDSIVFKFDFLKHFSINDLNDQSLIAKVIFNYLKNHYEYEDIISVDQIIIKFYNSTEEYFND